MKTTFYLLGLLSALVLSHSLANSAGAAPLITDGKKIVGKVSGLYTGLGANGHRCNYPKEPSRTRVGGSFVMRIDAFGGISGGTAATAGLDFHDVDGRGSLHGRLAPGGVVNAQLRNLMRGACEWKGRLGWVNGKITGGGTWKCFAPASLCSGTWKVR